MIFHHFLFFDEMTNKRRKLNWRSEQPPPPSLLAIINLQNCSKFKFKLNSTRHARRSGTNDERASDDLTIGSGASSKQLGGSTIIHAPHCTRRVVAPLVVGWGRASSEWNRMEWNETERKRKEKKRRRDIDQCAFPPSSPPCRRVFIKYCPTLAWVRAWVSECGIPARLKMVHFRF